MYYALVKSWTRNCLSFVVSLLGLFQLYGESAAAIEVRMLGVWNGSDAVRAGAWKSVGARPEIRLIETAKSCGTSKEARGRSHR